MDIDHHSVQKLVKGHKKGYKGKPKSKDSLKVTYISSPMKVKTSACRFRSLVQQLTGKNSDISRYVESNYSADGFHKIGRDDVGDVMTHERRTLSSISTEDTTSTSSDSLFGSMGNVLVTCPMEEQQFAGIFSSVLFSNRDDQLDHVLGSYDELL
ncbi:UNVERIFIED_CONTAM: hypothetical protein Sradi_0570900 [Sesamum radiatum]|uniref:VQ domain-containing protein n=1 Tax=Sesamum radiatum TaxID=300843 RepID=A0AAW2VKB4_SESRA